MQAMIIINHAPEDGLQAWNGFRVASIFGKRKEFEYVFLFLLGDGVRCGQKNLSEQGGKSAEIAKLIEELKVLGVKMLACKTCLGECAIEPPNLIDGVDPGKTVEDLVEWTLNSDNVLVF